MTRLVIVLLAVVSLFVVETCCQDGGARFPLHYDKEEAAGSEISKDSGDTIGKLFQVISPVKSDDEDDAGWSGDGGSGSGESGSGVLTVTTDEPTKASTLAPDTEEGSGTSTTTTNNSPSQPTKVSPTTRDHEEINPTTKGEPSTTTDMDNSVTDSQENSNTFNVDDNSMMRQSHGRGNNNSDSGGLSFTVGIIAGVVIGALLAILIVLFLVYRLRKKDAGSYLLEDHSSGYRPMPGSPGGDKEYYT